MGIRALCLTAVLCGCSLWASQEPGPAELALRQAMLETALGQIGRPYRYGGADGDGFDCSGLVLHVYGDAGVKVPRTARQQLEAGERIHLKDAEPGDLVFYEIDGGVHVAIYVGDGRVVHAPSRGKDVTVTSVHTRYWEQRFIAAVRMLES